LYWLDFPADRQTHPHKNPNSNTGLRKSFLHTLEPQRRGPSVPVATTNLSFVEKGR